MSVRVSGQDTIKAALAKARQASTDDNIGKAAEDWLQLDYLPVAKARAPYVTGAFRDSIDGIVSGNVITIFATVPYAGYLEWGTSKMSARPTLGPVLQETYPKLLIRIRNQISQ